MKNYLQMSIDFHVVIYEKISFKITIDSCVVYMTYITHMIWISRFLYLLKDKSRIVEYMCKGLSYIDEESQAMSFIQVKKYWHCESHGKS